MNITWLVPFSTPHLFSYGLIDPEFKIDLPDVNINATIWMTFFWPVLDEEPYARCRFVQYEYIDEEGVIQTKVLESLGTPSGPVWIQVNRCISITFRCQVSKVTMRAGGMIYYVE